ncbi:MAG: tRNA (adenosine(37)-N6)-dimethylallyltransferase [Kiritimatiellia bacterium]
MARREAYLLAGATASGKSAAAALLAREMGAAILSADSMLVYRGMDVGTAKPSAAERAEFSMGGVDVVTPAEHFSSGAWLRAAAAWLAEVPASRPIVIVGGTGLYFSALLRGLDREWTSPPPAYPVLQADRAVLHARIARRLDAMFMDGLAAEVAELRRQYPVWSDTASAAIGYKEFIEGSPLDAVRERILVRTRQLAKRQDTWFRHQSTPLYVPIGETPEETAANVRRIWRAHGPWTVSLETKGT